MFQAGLKRTDGFRAKLPCPLCHRKVAVKGDKYGPHINEETGQRCYPGAAPAGALVARQKRMKPGEKNELWRQKLAPEIHEAYRQAGVDRCEFAGLGIESEPTECFGKNTIAHSRKQRNTSILEWLTHHAIACVSHHRVLDEVLDEDQMYDAIDLAVHNRGWAFTLFHPVIRQYWPDIAKYFGKRWIQEIWPLLNKKRGELLAQKFGRPETPPTDDECELLAALQVEVERTLDDAGYHLSPLMEKLRKQSDD